ncbi:hypothetical protein ABUU09_20520, partial [Escherichia coli]|uniref:hypothetical protein n=1 Tax=Escherichia coli TaxID=562 RepID=UPI0033571718
ADRNRSHWSTSKTPSYTKSVSWQHHLIQQVAAPVRGGDETTVAEVTEMKNSERLNDMPHL